MLRFKNSIVIDLSIVCFLVLLLAGAYALQWSQTEQLEYKAYDTVSSFRDKAPASNVVVIGIDNNSITAIGRWPWSRGYIAQMIGMLHDYETRVIGIDIPFSENDHNQGLTEIRNLLSGLEAKGIRSGQLYTSLKEAEGRLDNDTLLAESIARSHRVVLPLTFALGRSLAAVEALPDYLTRNSVRLDTTAPSLTARELISPIAQFAEPALALGHVNVAADKDGAVRSEPLLINYENRYYPSFALQLTLKFLKYNLDHLRLNKGIEIGNARIPTFDEHRMLINYNWNIPIYSFVDVLNHKVRPAVFKNKIVIIVLNATGLGTFQATSAGPDTPSWIGIASTVDNILHQEHIVRPAWAVWLELAVMVLFGCFVILVTSRLKPLYSAAAALTLLILWAGFSVYLLAGQGYWIKPVYPALVLILGYLAMASRKYLFSEKPKVSIEADSVEANKMLGLSFQGQGMLDMAFETFRKCPVEDKAMKELLYNLGLDFERKRLFTKAVAVYNHIAQAGSFKDINDRIQRMKLAGDTVNQQPAGSKKDDTVILQDTEIKPTIGRYEISRELGRGAMGTVYLGKDPKINREVAIKTLRYEEIEDERLLETKKRFFLEAEAAGKLSHPNIVTIYDVGEDSDLAYMAMELLDGTDLMKYCGRDSLLPIPEVVRIVSLVANALDYAHKNGVVHRDIKPSNIMILKNGEIRVADFGIARVMSSSKTQTGAVLGTPSYMSPEQISGQKIDGRSDLFSLGVVFYEMLTGEKPFQGDSIGTLMYKITSTNPKPLRERAPHLPELFADIVNRAMEKDADKRYQHGGEIVDDLAAYLKI
ncbi:serine/threonine protein kinase [Syntrophus gentianae]|uniref:non-specific serine/threonine protein kinase n=1 Tax=Syntrophus gentianae TaxID=43775 RepID=A0A1H8A5Y1_9BACT|nr:serine/threonine-protein kinase [Syntrophus gentianae]SEM66001.1 serine/threonine protein kinase [Syntrophus gentianae]